MSGMIQTDTGPTLEPSDFPEGRVRRILIVVPGRTAATQVGYEVPFQLLTEPEFGWRIIPEYLLKAEDLAEINVLILYRCLRGMTLSVTRLARLKQIKVIYELDDDLLDPPDDETWGQFYRRNHYPKVMELFLAEADLVKAGSPKLAYRLARKGYPTLYQPYAVRLRRSPVKIPGNSPYRVGYFGTPHHQADIESIFPALMTVKEKLRAKVEFEFFGCYPRGWQQLAACLFPYEPDYELFMEALLQRGWDLGLAPLRNTFFNEAKSNSKFRDFTAAGILGIYADLAPYRDSVVHGQNGWLVGPDSELWSQTLCSALDCPGRSEMLNQAQHLVQRTYNPETVARNWLKLIEEIVKR